jgi:putative transposase
MVGHLIAEHKLSERTACKLIGISRSSHRYAPASNNDDALREQLKALAVQYPKYGYLMLHNLLRRDGLVVNKKRTYRLYRGEGLQVRTKKRKRLQRPRQPMAVLTRVNERWSMDFVYDQLANGRRFRVLNVIDDFSREMIGQLVMFSISGHQVTRFLNQLIEARGAPSRIVCDNGTEFTSKAMFFWSKESRVGLGFIQPGKPTQNAFVESVNGKFRNECLNLHWFRTIEEARYEIDLWRTHYNHERPHSSLNYLSPVAFAKLAA